MLNDVYLSRGFAVASASELVNGLHNNPVLQAETLMMLKERFIEQHGPPSWTVGDGVSGGASAQLCVTNAYPGLLDGLQPAMAFPDMTMYRVWDCVLFQGFWRGADPGVWTEAKRAAVEGYSRGLCSHQQEWNLGGVFLRDEGGRLRTRGFRSRLRPGPQPAGRPLHLSRPAREHIRPRSEDRLRATPSGQRRRRVRPRGFESRCDLGRRVPRAQRTDRRPGHRWVSDAGPDGGRPPRDPGGLPERPDQLIRRRPRDGSDHRLARLQ